MPGFRTNTIEDKLQGKITREELLMEEREKARNELASLMAQIDAAKAILREQNVKGEDLLNLEEEIQEALEKRKQVNIDLQNDAAEYGRLLDRIAMKRQELEDYKQLQELAASKQRELQYLQAQLEQTQAQINSELVKGQEEMSDIQVNIDRLEKQEKNHQDVVREVISQRDSLSREKEVLLSEITLARAERDDVKKETETAKAELSEFRSLVSQSKNQLDALEKEVAARRSEEAIRQATVEKQWDEREAELTLREGAVSDREFFLDYKEKQLIKMKEELEKFHGKKIPINL